MISRGMKISSSLFLAILILTSSESVGSPVRITGSGPGYSGAELRIYIYTDPVTDLEYPVKRVNCDESGRFSSEIDIKGSSTILIRSGVFKFILYAEPDSELDLLLPEYIPRPRGEEENPFYSEVNYIPEVLNSEDNINNLMRDFDMEYNPVYNSVAHRVFNNFRRDELPKLIQRLNTVSDNHNNNFFSDYVKYRMIMLNLVASGEYQGRIEDSVLINRRFDYENPAYNDLIDQLFSGYFRRVMSGPLRDSCINALYYASLKGLREVIYLDGKASDAQLVDFIILINIYPEYFSGSLPRENIMKIMTDLSTDGSSSYIRNISKAAAARLDLYTRGRSLPETGLKTLEGKDFRLSSLSGENLLLCFFSKDDQNSQLELTMLQMWIMKYAPYLRVVFILKAKDSAGLQTKINSVIPSALILVMNDPDVTEYLYDIRMYPFFILLDRDNNIFVNPAPMASENLESAIITMLNSQRSGS